MLSPERKSEILLSNMSDSDCGVIALQAITGMRRQLAMKLMLKNGYQPVLGTERGGVERALESKGYTVELVDEDEIYNETAASFAMSHPNGKYLVYTARPAEGFTHVMALVDGDLSNSRGHWHDKIFLVTHASK